MKAFKTLGQALALSALALGTATGSVEARGQSTLKGQISLKGQPVSGSSITLWQTQAGQFPKQLSTQRSNQSGQSPPETCHRLSPKSLFLNTLFGVANGSS